MASDKEIHDALMAVHSRLGTIDGKVNLMARSGREAVRAELKDVVQKTPMIGRIYLLLDGSLTQDGIVTELAGQGRSSSKPAVSRYLNKMANEHGMADLVPTSGRGNVYRKNNEMEKIINLAEHVEKWLAENDSS